MSLVDHSRPEPSARRLLVEAGGSPFAPSPTVKPVVDVLDGRETNASIEPDAWLRALKACNGAIAVYFGLEADHEWWLAYDSEWEDSEPDGENRDADGDAGLFDGFDLLEGPWNLWTTYPTGPWDHDALPRQIAAHHLDGLHLPSGCQIRRSKVVPLRDAPEWVREEIGR